MKFHYRTTSTYAIVALVSQACFIRAAETGASTTRNFVERDLSSKQHHGQTLTIDFDEMTTGSDTGDEFGWYSNEHIQMENFRYWLNPPAIVVKSPPNAAYHYGNWAPAIMSCPGGSFDLISVCLTHYIYTTFPDIVAVFKGTLAHDDMCGITIDQEQGTQPLKYGKMKCLNFNRGYKDLSSVDITQILLETGKPAVPSRVYFDDIKIRIHRPCDVDNQQALNRMSKNMEGDELAAH